MKLPYYSVRKCPTTELKDLGISVGDPVFVVPSSDAMTKYVFTDKIRQYVKRQMVGNRFNQEYIRDESMQPRIPACITAFF